MKYVRQSIVFSDGFTSFHLMQRITYIYLIFSLLCPISILAETAKGMVFLDANKNGIKDNHEKGLSNEILTVISRWYIFRLKQLKRSLVKHPKGTKVLLQLLLVRQKTILPQKFYSLVQRDLHNRKLSHHHKR